MPFFMGRERAIATIYIERDDVLTSDHSPFKSAVSFIHLKNGD